jgi:hypothetical protein
MLFQKKIEALAFAAFSVRIEVVCALRLAGVSIIQVAKFVAFNCISGTSLISINWG